MSRIVVAASAGITVITAGAIGLVVETINVITGAQVSDGMVVLLSGTALGIGTTIFGFTFKKLMDVMSMQSQQRVDSAVLAKTVEDQAKDIGKLEKKVMDLEGRLNQWEK